MRPIEQERDWELAARRQSRANLLKWVLIAIEVAIVVVLALVRAAPSQVVAKHPIWQTGELSPGILKLVETHCVAVIPSPNTIVPGNYKGEQLLNLRCK